jgi:DNA polymerase-3 subunit beta
LRTTPDDTVTLEGDASAVTLKSSDGRFRILGQDPEDFADIPPLPETEAVEIDPTILNYMVDRTTFATAAEKGRYALNGILVLLDEEGTFEMVAADGARLSNVEKKADNPGEITMDHIVMKKGIQQAARLGALVEEPLKIQVTESQFLAENSAGRMSCQLVEGQFPNYREVIPRENKYKAQFPTKSLLNALRRASFLTSETTNAVDFEFTQDTLVLKSQSPDLGDAEVRVNIEYSGEETEISFNPAYIEDMLETVERETVKFEFNDRRSPCLLSSGVDFRYVVSPVVREDAENV